ncbi:hypothetical protein HDU77_001728 [Chytriomyces hyalinus]|nr:hypothetical protein HDU77_001728 [Chytriomyces hyalinus]
MDLGILAATTSQLWSIVIGSGIVDASEIEVIAQVCHGAFSATKHERVKAEWALKRHAQNAFVVMHSQYPRALSLGTVHAMFSMGAVLPRHLVLLLVREKLAHERFANNLDKHLKYQTEVRRMLEWRAMELEAQRMTVAVPELPEDASANRRDIHEMRDDDGESPTTKEPASTSVENALGDDAEQKIDIALVPLPSYAEIPHVPYPDAVPESNTAFLPHGARDAMIQYGEDVYGAVFYAKNAPPTMAERLYLLPDELHWTTNIAHGEEKAPVTLWPFDDAAMFSYLVRYGGVLRSMMPTDTAKDIPSLSAATPAVKDASENSENVSPADESREKEPDSPLSGASTQPSTSYAVTRYNESWKRICASLWVLIHRHAFSPRFVIEMEKSLKGLASFQQRGVAVDFSIGDSADAEDKWLLGEILHHDEALGRLLASIAHVPQDVVENEVIYWTLVDSKIQSPQRRHAAPNPSEESHMRQHLAKLPSEIPMQPLRRFIKNHASKTALSRLAEFTATPLEKIHMIGNDLISSLVSPTNLSSNPNPNAALHRVDVLVDALGVTAEALLEHFMIPDWEAYTDSEAIINMSVAAAAKAADSSNLNTSAVDDDYDDLFNSYAPLLQTKTAQLLTKMGAETGVVPWSYWTYLVARYTSPTTVLRETWKNEPATKKILSILIHDLTVRRAAVSLDAEGGRVSKWFGEKEADTAVFALLSQIQNGNGSVELFKSTVLEICRRVFETASVRSDDDVEAVVVPARFVAVMALLEKQMVGSSPAPLDAKGAVMFEMETVDDEAVAKNPWNLKSPTEIADTTHLPPDISEWCRLLDQNVINHAGWQELVQQTSSATEDYVTENNSMPPHVRFYWSVASLVEDAIQKPTSENPALSKFYAWRLEQEAASSANSTKNLGTSIEGGERKPGFMNFVSSKANDWSAAFTSTPVGQGVVNAGAQVGKRVSSMSSAIAGNPVVGATTAKLTSSVVSMGGTVNAGISSLVGTLSKTLGGSRDSVAELQKKEAEKSSSANGVDGSKSSGGGSVELIGGDGGKEKQARDAVWNRLSSRLSTSKVEKK